ncbi:DUF6924 domain-containing protein [Streptomyces mirabilis]|uniref:DUF6924 domain-containing protein n=1 Tax=Streptomyces mirabilis TaxID=68239 RepID=UPI0032485D10
MDFTADDPSDEVTLKVRALVSKSGPVPGHAPLDILVNGQSVISRFRIPGGGDLPQLMTFAVPGEWLRSGSNTLEVRSAQDSRTTLWLYQMLLESVWDRDAAERALQADRSAKSVYSFVTYHRSADSSEWQSGPQLQFQIDDGQAAPPAELSWRGSDGGEAAISFVDETTSFLGHARTAGGVWLQLRGDLIERREHPDGHAQRFRTEANRGEKWHESGELSVSLDTGSGPVERIGWRDQRGNTASIGLCHDGASFTGYVQRVSEGLIGYRGVIGDAPKPRKSPDTRGASQAKALSKAISQEVLNVSGGAVIKLSLVIRTFFGDQQAWENLVTTLETSSGDRDDEHPADLTCVDDPSFADMSVEQLRDVVRTTGRDVFYVADETAHTTDEQLLLLVIDRDEVVADGPQEARCVAADLHYIDPEVSMYDSPLSELIEVCFPASEDGVIRASQY